MSLKKLFGSAEKVLLLVIIIIFAFLAIYYFSFSKDSKDTTSDQETTQNAQIEFMDIPELGIKISKTSKLSGLNYTESNSNAINSKVYQFSSPELDNTITSCDKSETSGSFKYVFAEVYKSSGQFDAATSSESSILKQFDDFFVARISQPLVSPCKDEAGNMVDNQEVSDEIAVFQKELGEAFSVAEKL